ncbi:hypothetical protein [Micromonospora zamorensis]|uniref:hypothetical protein n=1 Tax=Micromonospora zamorensis TaxID=709883 RepID=UPI003407F3AA
MEERLSDDWLIEWQAKVPTLPLPAVTALTRLLTEYVARFPTTQVRGGVALLHGEHGSGKTHTVRYALSRLAINPNDVAPLLCYVKAQDHDFLGTYRRLMAQFSRADLRELSLGFLAAIAAEQAGAEITAQSVRHNPDLFYALFDGYLVERGAVLEAQAVELSRVAGGREDFQRALTFLLDDQLAGAAYDWLVGNTVDPLDAKRLGVRGSIVEPELCRYGIQLLVSMSVRAGRPIVLVLDQCERLLLDERHHLWMPNVGLLHSLVETVPQAGGMLVLIGSAELWAQLPLDLRQRIGANDITAGTLTVGSATQLLEVYINAVTGGSGCHPFTDGAIRALLTAAGGNIRRLLQVSYEAFEEAAVERDLVDAATVRRAAGGGRALLGRNDAEHAIERLLLDEKVPFARDWRKGPAIATYAVEADGVPTLLVHVTEALFSDDEASNALDSFALVEHVHRNRWPARVAVVVLGYVSPDVLMSLSRAAHDVIVFTGASSVEVLRPVVANLRPAPSQTNLGQLDDIERALKALAASRNEEVTQLRQEVARLSAEHGRGDGSGTVRSRWAERRLQLVERIREARGQRRAQELRELQQLHGTAVRERILQTATFCALMVGLVLLVAWLLKDVNRAGGRAIGGVLTTVGIAAILISMLMQVQRRAALRPFQLLAVGGCGAALTVIGFGLLSGSNGYASFDDTVTATQAFLVVMAFVVGAVALLDISGSVSTGPRQMLRRPADSVERLHVTARAAMQRLPRATSRSVSYMLADHDPHVRYAGLLGAARIRMTEDVLDLLHREPSSFLRRVAAAQLAVEPDPELTLVIRDIAKHNRFKEITYYAASTAQPDSFEGAEQLHLASLLGVKPQTADVRRHVLNVLLPSAGEDLTERLAMTLQGRLEPDDPISRKPSERDLSQALRALSPFEINGLGTLDDLPNVSDVDEWYLFFEQLSFYRNATPDS